MINYLIVDDEPQARKLLQAYMAGLTNYKLVKLCANAMEAYEALHASKIDLMFLDIKMPIVSGTDFLRSLKNPPLVIFTTAFNKYAMEGYELNVVDYLLKPIALPRLLNALEKVQVNLNAQKTSSIENKIDYLFVKVDHKLVKINLDEILLIEGLQNYVKIHLKERILIANYTMKAIESMLSGQFIRVHRSFIVPLHTILSIEGNLIDTTYQQVPIGSSFKTAVMSYIHHKPD
ncbi:LytR/AlgR family response regulator transcription factor [Pedobacter sp. UC225_65]|uniref:LytR/AlgR family response regulator transcription factor n=1 Tax=Pedobacter sp. UC225_65 TaxID=3350173 RepID=UPI003670706E